MDQSAILHLEGIYKQFPRTDAPAVEAVTLTLNQGDILGLLGPSGCGKTTLLRMIAGFERPDRGAVEIAGRVVADVKQWVPPERRDVGMVFQDYALFPHLTVAKNVAFGLQALKKKSPKAVKHRVAEVLELVGLSGLGDRYPHELSGGQQQRVALARALAPGPALVLLDEPLSNLDVQVRLRLRQELREILKAAGTSGVFVTHDQEEALSISDWVAVMRGGRLEQWGTPEEIYLQPASRFVAEFVTQANFIPARRRGDRWETEVGCFAIAPDIDEIRPESGRADLMVRQEDFILKPDETAPVVIRDRQFLGRELHYCLRVPSGRELIARTRAGGRSLPVGMRVRVTVPEEAVRVFPVPSAEAGLPAWGVGNRE
ncbi:ABC transporter ATP-binding protein [Lyngbya sp. CCY1209]|uniref:ABC transporter ATP-binding protein n=1 Tax=Lyngbya sp. CCY1209 TaxID=2886103 RepID=UPI002D1FFB9F|nr:ABC transporter ATP-binding protein [Lyngbya sp. CCY1209]MEB3883787.1 ABC transporter ATP-binding protein [Lyngbya sp. CCY1209]